MNFIKIKYVGGRKQVKANWTRKSYIFNEANGFTLDIPDKLVRELLTTGNYMPVKEVQIIEDVKDPIEEILENDVKDNVEEKKQVGRPKGSFKKRRK